MVIRARRVLIVAKNQTPVSQTREMALVCSVVVEFSGTGRQLRFNRQRRAARAESAVGYSSMEDRTGKDWRLQGQERYLAGTELVWRAYRQNSDNLNWDHDHCAFCWAKFMVDDRMADLAGSSFPQSRHSAARPTRTI
jgi:hypothetical protein